MYFVKWVWHSYIKMKLILSFIRRMFVNYKKKSLKNLLIILCMSYTYLHVVLNNNHSYNYYAFMRSCFARVVLHKFKCVGWFWKWIVHLCHNLTKIFIWCVFIFVLYVYFCIFVVHTVYLGPTYSCAFE